MRVPSHPTPQNCGGSLIVRCPERGLAGLGNHRLVLWELESLISSPVSLLPRQAPTQSLEVGMGFSVTEPTT